MMASVDSALFRGLQYRLVAPSRGGRVTTVPACRRSETFTWAWQRGLFGPPMPARPGSPSPMASTRGIDGLRRRCGIGSEHHLPLHRLGRCAEQRPTGRCVPDDRRWPDVAFIGLYNAGQIAPCGFTRPIEHRLGRRYGDIFKPNTDANLQADGRRRSWKKRSTSPQHRAMDCELHRRIPHRLRLMNRIERKPWRSSAARGGRIHKSTDGGETWTRGALGFRRS